KTCGRDDVVYCVGVCERQVFKPGPFIAGVLVGFAATADSVETQHRHAFVRAPERRDNRSREGKQGFLGTPPSRRNDNSGRRLSGKRAVDYSANMLAASVREVDDFDFCL